MLSTARKVLTNIRWLPGYYSHLTEAKKQPDAATDLIFAVADHFEPCFSGVYGQFTSLEEQIERVKNWATKYPQAVDPWRDSDGHPFKHTYFYPAEHYHPEVLDLLSAHCKGGWGETEIHLHHGVERPDTSSNTRELLEVFRDRLVSHGCLSRLDSRSPFRYAFVHGNWALANSNRNRFCGVDDEMKILAETGCYADFTLPSAPDPAQVNKVNSIYECAMPLDGRAPHRRGRDLRVGVEPLRFPVLVQGPLVLNRNRGRLMPKIENSELTARNPPTLDRLKLWREAVIRIVGRPEWLFIKLHCHGMIPEDASAMYGEALTGFLKDLAGLPKEGPRIHFTSAREMFNIILAACDGKQGNPHEYRDYRFILNGKEPA